MRPRMHWWPSEYLFLLTHPDSMTAAFAALLFEQLGICACCGSHLTYEHRLDLMRLRWHLACSQRRWPCGRYLFDAIVDHDTHVPLQLTRSQRLRLLVCVRRPLSALTELLASGVADTPEAAAELYCTRLEWLAAASHNLGQRALVFPTEMIVADTNTLLAAIALHLDLQADFRTVPELLADEERDPTTQERWPAVLEETCSAGAWDPLLTAQCHEAYHYAMQELAHHCFSVGLGHLRHGAPPAWRELDAMLPAALPSAVERKQVKVQLRHVEDALQ
jgi:hypothetical protein